MNEMLDVARTALERYHDVAVDDDGTLTFAHGGVVCAVQGTELDEGLPVHQPDLRRGLGPARGATSRRASRWASGRGCSAPPG